MTKSTDVYELFCYVGLENIVNNIYIGIADYITHKLESFCMDLVCCGEHNKHSAITNNIVNKLQDLYPVDAPRLKFCINRSVECRKNVLSLEMFMQRLASSTTYEDLYGVGVNGNVIDQKYFDYYKKAYAIFANDTTINSIIGDEIINGLNLRG